MPHTWRKRNKVRKGSIKACNVLRIEFASLTVSSATESPQRNEPQDGHRAGPIRHSDSDANRDAASHRWEPYTSASQFARYPPPGQEPPRYDRYVPPPKAQSPRKTNAPPSKALEDMGSMTGTLPPKNPTASNDARDKSTVPKPESEVITRPREETLQDHRRALQEKLKAVDKQLEEQQRAGQKLEEQQKADQKMKVPVEQKELQRSQVLEVHKKWQEYIQNALRELEQFKQQQQDLAKRQIELQNEQQKLQDQASNRIQQLQRNLAGIAASLN